MESEILQVLAVARHEWRRHVLSMGTTVYEDHNKHHSYALYSMLGPVFAPGVHLVPLAMEAGEEIYRRLNHPDSVQRFGHQLLPPPASEDQDYTTQETQQEGAGVDSAIAGPQQTIAEYIEPSSPASEPLTPCPHRAGGTAADAAAVVAGILAGLASMSVRSAQKSAQMMALAAPAAPHTPLPQKRKKNQRGPISLTKPFSPDTDLETNMSPTLLRSQRRKKWVIEDSSDSSSEDVHVDTPVPKKMKTNTDDKAGKGSTQMVDTGKGRYSAEKMPEMASHTQHAAGESSEEMDLSNGYSPEETESSNGVATEKFGGVSKLKLPVASKQSANNQIPETRDTEMTEAATTSETRDIEMTTATEKLPVPSPAPDAQDASENATQPQLPEPPTSYYYGLPIATSKAHLRSAPQLWGWLRSPTLAPDFFAQHPNAFDWLKLALVDMLYADRFQLLNNPRVLLLLAQLPRLSALFLHRLTHPATPFGVHYTYPDRCANLDELLLPFRADVARADWYRLRWVLLNHAGFLAWLAASEADMAAFWRALAANHGLGVLVRPVRTLFTRAALVEKFERRLCEESVDSALVAHHRRRGGRTLELLPAWPDEADKRIVVEGGAERFWLECWF